MTSLFPSLGARAACLLAAWAGIAAPALGQAPTAVTVTEFHNIVLDHYFLTASGAEADGIDRGAAGPGWIRTGRGFSAFTQPDCPGCFPVARFYGTPGLGPNSHFFTASAAESSFLQRPGSGWSLESAMAFAVPMPDAAGSCPSTAPLPVLRFYNDRWRFNDSNHRYVTAMEDRAAMSSRGWIQEGVAFCAAAAEEVALRTFRIDVPPAGNILTSAGCTDESQRMGGCVAVNNLPVPTEPRTFAGGVPVEISNLTALATQVHSPPGVPLQEVAGGVFVQGSGATYGIHVEARGKGPTEFSSINPLHQLPTRAVAADEWFFPWRAYPFEAQLSIRWGVEVRRIEARTPTSHAYGHPTLEFIDARSAKHLYFTVLAYGTIDGGDYLAPDVGTGIVIVGTTPRADTPYGRTSGSDWIRTPRSFAVGSGPGLRGQAEFRMDRVEFGRILESARRVDPGLSADPRDYLLDNFHFNNEVVGDGEIGLNLQLEVRVLRR